MEDKYWEINKVLRPYQADMVAASKLQKPESILELYALGHRDFGENYVQECLEKQEILPNDIRWHFIGHLQTNKVKFLVPFVTLIHGVDSLKLLKEINKEAGKINRQQDVLIQIYIAKEETKYGFSFDEAQKLFSSTDLLELKHIRIQGFMGMASFSDDANLIRSEFHGLKEFYKDIKELHPNYAKHFKYLSMGMTSDYKIALEEGSNLVRIGSALFGERPKQKV